MNLKITKEAVEWFFNRNFGEHTPFADMSKARKICDMRLQGHTYPQISVEVGLSADRTRFYVAKVNRAYERMLKHEEYKMRQTEQDKLKDIYRMIEIEYQNANQCEHIRKPLAYALHEVWRRVDRKEKERNVN